MLLFFLGYYLQWVHVDYITIGLMIVFQFSLYTLLFKEYVINPIFCHTVC